MQIILHAGDCRNLLNEAINDLLDDKSEEEVKDKITQAKKEITKAHVIQTDKMCIRDSFNIVNHGMGDINIFLFNKR